MHLFSLFLIGKKEIPWSPQSSSAPFILLCCQTHSVGQGWWQPPTKLPLAVTFVSLPLDQWGTNIHASWWSLPMRRNPPPFLWVRDQQQLLCKRGYLSKHCGGWFSHPMNRSRVHCRCRDGKMCRYCRHICAIFSLAVLISWLCTRKSAKTILALCWKQYAKITVLLAVCYKHPTANTSTVLLALA